MAETAALLADEVLPALALRQRVISLPLALRSCSPPGPRRSPGRSGARALGIIYRVIATHLAQ